MAERGVAFAMQTFALIEGSRCRLRSDAAIGIAGRLGGLWGVFRLLSRVPRPLRDSVYTYVATRRYRWFGPSASCIPQKADRPSSDGRTG